MIENSYLKGNRKPEFIPAFCFCRFVFMPHGLWLTDHLLFRVLSGDKTRSKKIIMGKGVSLHNVLK
jgi:hypothetical protein